MIKAVRDESLKERIKELYKKHKNELLDELLDEILESSNDYTIALCYSVKNDKLFVSRFFNPPQSHLRTIPIYEIPYPAETRDDLEAMFDEADEEFSEEEEKREIMKDTLDYYISEALEKLKPEYLDEVYD